MTSDAVRIKVLNEEIEKQLAALKDLEARNVLLKSEISENEIRLQYLSKHIDLNKGELEELGESFKEEKLQPNLDVTIILSMETTFNFILENDDPNGLQIKDISEMYSQAGVLTNARMVTNHINELEKVGKIYRVNPEAQRGKRYRAVSNKEGDFFSE